MKAKTVWQASDQTNAKYLGTIELQDSKGEFHTFEVLQLDSRLLFGGMCNAGFLESGYILRNEGETLDETLDEMHQDLGVFYSDGPQYVSRIVCNDRM